MNWIPDIFGRRKIKELESRLHENWLERLELKSKLPKAIFTPGAPLGWQTDNVLELRAFLKTPTGQLLIQRARAMEYSLAVRNAKDQFHTQHAAGNTTGFSDALNWIESLASDQLLQNLSRPPGDQGGKTDTASGEQDDAALVERFSP